ncbi:MAG: hypothetical protein IT260_18990 [Saprospiraceae bacterium]|nr:hypothetical protein [Saprospiraceae bacterium]
MFDFRKPFSAGYTLFELSGSLSLLDDAIVLGGGISMGIGGKSAFSLGVKNKLENKLTPLFGASGSIELNFLKLWQWNSYQAKMSRSTLLR